MPALLGASPSSSEWTVREERLEVGFVVPHGEERAARQIRAPTGVVAAPGAEQSPELESGHTGQPESIRSEPAEHERGLPQRFVDEVERCDATHVWAMLSPMDVDQAVTVAVTIVVGYLIGSIPIANLVAARRARIDLREVGDRNPGFWNARETLGRRAAIPVFVGDSAKGVVAALVGTALADPGVWGLAYVGCGAAMVGHAFPVFARFRGGRSILTFAGGAAVFATVPFLISIGLLLVTFAVRRSFAVAARVGFVAFPIVQLVIEGPYRTAATGVLMTFIGLRFAMAAIADRRLANRQP